MTVRFTTLLLVCLLAGCENRSASQTQARTGSGELYTVNIRVHPDHAMVSVQDRQDTLFAIVELRGPLASFHLPAGEYHYEVHATDFESFSGTFELPRNRNLEVWLTPR